MSSPYLNGTREKQCPICSDWFRGDETLKGELCPICEDLPDCPNCDGKTHEEGEPCDECQEKESTK